jgi:hypothetical protein
VTIPIHTPSLQVMAPLRRDAYWYSGLVFSSTISFPHLCYFTQILRSILSFFPFSPNIPCVFLSIHIDFLGIQMRHACDHGLAPFFSSLTFLLISVASTHPIILQVFFLRHLDPLLLHVITFILYTPVTLSSIPTIMTVLSAISTQFFHHLPALTRILSRGAVVVQMHLLPQLLSLRPGFHDSHQHST